MLYPAELWVRPASRRKSGALRISATRHVVNDRGAKRQSATRSGTLGHTGKRTENFFMALWTENPRPELSVECQRSIQRDQERRSGPAEGNEQSPTDCRMEYGVRLRPADHVCPGRHCRNGTARNRLLKTAPPAMCGGSPQGEVPNSSFRVAGRAAAGARC